jgi:putative thioredoxin
MIAPILEEVAQQYEGKLVVAKVDVDANQALAARYDVQGIPAVKAFRDGKVAAEFVGAVPRAKVDELFDSLVPSRADELLERGDELALREAAELEPRRADIAAALGRVRLERGAVDEALEAVSPHAGDFAADGIASRVRLAKAGVGSEAFAAADRGEVGAAVEALIAELEGAEPESRDELRRAIVGLLGDPRLDRETAARHRRRLATALY